MNYITNFSLNFIIIYNFIYLAFFILDFIKFEILFYLNKTSKSIVKSQSYKVKIKK